MKGMRKVIIISFAMLLACEIAAQSEEGNVREQIETMKVAFINKYVDISPAEAEKFWPLYNEYEKKLIAIKKSAKGITEYTKAEVEKMSVAEIQQAVDNYILMRQKEVDLIKEYHQRFLNVLSPQKVAKLYLAREEFKRYLLQKIREGKSKN